MVRAAAAQHFMAQPEHDRRVAARSRGDPQSVRPFRDVIGHRAYDDEPGTAPTRPANMVRHVVKTGAAGRHAPVLRIEPAESHHDIAIAGNAVPAGRGPGYGFVASEHVLQDNLRRAPAVVSRLIREAAERAEEPANLAARVMEPAGTRPAVGAGKDRSVPMPVADTLQFVRNQIQSPVPAQRNHSVGTPVGAVGSCPVAQPPWRTKGWLMRVSA